MTDYRPLAKTSHIVKTLEQLLLCLLRPQVEHAQDCLQVAYQEHIRVDDAVIYMLHWNHSHLDEPGAYMRIMFFKFSSVFNTIQPHILRGKLEGMVCAYLPHGLDFGLPDGMTTVGQVGEWYFWGVGEQGAPQGMMLAPFPFTLYTTDFKYQSESCYVQ